MNGPTITLTEMDYLRLDRLLDSGKFEDLEYEIGRAQVMDFPEIPTDLITMNTTFRYLNVTDNKYGEMTIVYPEHAELDAKKISVLAPLGSAFIGLREEDEIDWTFPDGVERRLKVVEVLHQPEANGDLHS
jgi:regulator of nucleoside diphosphate kinase